MLKQVSIRYLDEKLKVAFGLERYLFSVVELLEGTEGYLNQCSDRVTAWSVWSKEAEEIELTKNLTGSVEHLYVLKKTLLDYLEQYTRAEIPNLHSLLGARLASKMLRESSGLKRLSRMAPSQVQILGAGGAIFRHLKKGVPSPKHGIIFSHPMVRGTRARGKASRALACAISKAARIDYFSKELNPSVKERFIHRITEIRNRANVESHRT